jgi:prephenate dehydrogenase
MTLSHVRIVGSGLIGSSIGLALVQRGVGVTMVDSDSGAQALAQDLVKSSPSGDPDLIILASPISSISQSLESEKSSPVKLGFMDISSVKTKVKVEVSTSGLDPARFLPTHPMAGREVGGAQSARADLFQARPWILDSVGVDPQLHLAGLEVISLLGAIAIEMDSKSHDDAVALVSHLPQLVASLLASQLEGADESWLDLAGAGLRDTIRIAGSNPDLWKEIVGANSLAIAPLLTRFIEDAQFLLEGLSDEKVVAGVIAAGQRGRNLIPGKHGGQQRSYTYLPIVIEDKPGQLAALFEECARAEVNVEDLTIEHSPGQFTGLITLALSEEGAKKLSTHLQEKGWSVHLPR